MRASDFLTSEERNRLESAIAEAEHNTSGEIKGIDAVVPAGFWKDICAGLSSHFSRGTYADGLAEAINRVGEKLKTFFPYRSDDVNELPDEISFHENDGED